ncbi:hypothetical protein HispidOSU_009370 [Sigmodon hispidus]
MKQHTVQSHGTAVCNAVKVQDFGCMGNNQVIRLDKPQAYPCQAVSYPSLSSLEHLSRFPFARPTAKSVKEQAATISSAVYVVELTQLKRRLDVMSVRFCDLLPHSPTKERNGFIKSNSRISPSESAVWFGGSAHLS